MKKGIVIGISILIFISVFVWDAYLYIDPEPRNSISQVIIDLSSQSKLLPFFIGFFMGFLGAHWFDDSAQK